MAALMKAARFASKDGPIEIVKVEIPSPGPSQVLIKVEACGICHTDAFVQKGAQPGQIFPRIPGHEIIGTISKVGPGVTTFSEGQRVGVGYHAYHCLECDICESGDFNFCRKALVSGFHHDGGWAEYTVAHTTALARVPEGLTAKEAAPLMCAGLTCFNSLRSSPARPGDLVAIQGIGGLGHLAVQYARKMGFRVAAISGGTEKQQLAMQLGAHYYIDYKNSNPAQELLKLGAAKLIVATSDDSNAISQLFEGLGVNGQLLVLGASIEPLSISPVQLLTGQRSVRGWLTGTAKEAQDTLNFSELAHVKPFIEEFSLDDAEKAYNHMLSNKARFRVVLCPSSNKL
jgi:alcohol dehydrogenase/propanol-preferring alcohol dehydrogenase